MAVRADGSTKPAGARNEQVARIYAVLNILEGAPAGLSIQEILDRVRERGHATDKRTIYRDIATLIGQRVPIRGEAGTGYVLEKGFDMPPLTEQ